MLHKTAIQRHIYGTCLTSTPHREISVEDERIHLTVVNIGTEKINEVRRIIDAAAR